MTFIEEGQIHRELYCIHKAVLSDQNVFISHHIDSNEIPNRMSFDETPQNMLHGWTETETQLFVDVSEVICGNLQHGSQVVLFENDHDSTNLIESPLGFIVTSSGNNFKTIPSDIIKKYQSLTEEQKHTLVMKQKAIEQKKAKYGERISKAIQKRNRQK